MEGDFRVIRREASGSGLGWQIAVGVCCGILVANAITWGATELRVRWELEQAADKAKKVVDASRRAEESARQAAALDALEERQEIARQQRAAEASKQAAAEEVERREHAWKQFYRPSPGCSGTAASVDCSNEFIRAKRAFAAQYVAGR